MRVFNTVNDMYNEVCRDLKEMGLTYISDTIQDKQVSIETLELMGYGYTLTGYDDRYETARTKGINMDWLHQEISDRINIGLFEKNPGHAWKKNKDFWQPFLRDDRLAYTYPERMHPQIPAIIYELTKRPNTRQAVLTMYDWHQDLMNFGGRDRVPCSVSYQFLKRDNKLHCVYSMRSCDLVKFFLSDVVLSIELMTFIAKQLNIEPGNLTHVIGSLHAFKGDISEVF